MRKIIFLTLIVLGLSVNNAFCIDLQSQVNLLKYEVNKLDTLKDKEESDLLKPAIEANINHVADAIRKNIKKYQNRLEKIKDQNNDFYESSEGEEEASKEWKEKFKEKKSKKIESINKKIETLNDLLLLVEELKLKLTK